MAGYAKIWNDIWNDEWFIGLKGNERGFFLQLVSFAKARGDKSEIFLRNFRAFSHEFAFDSKTIGKMLGKFHQDSRIELTIGTNSTVRVNILNWQYWQEVRTVKGDSEAEKNLGKIRGKSSLPDQTKPNQTRPDQTKASGNLSDVPDSKLDSKTPQHKAEICQRIIDHYNQRATDIGKSTLRLDDLSYNIRQQFFECLGQKAFTVDELKKAVDGCFGKRFNRDGGHLRFGTIFKNADAVNGYILASENPEVDDSGSEISKSRRETEELLDEMGIK